MKISKLKRRYLGSVSICSGCYFQPVCDDCRKGKTDCSEYEPKLKNRRIQPYHVK